MNNLMILRQIGRFRGKLLQSSLKVGIRNLSTTKSLRKDHYEVLGIKRNATLAEIKNAYFELSKVYHPDRIAGTDENIAKFREITTAYEVLGNETSRRLYDKGLIGEKREGEEEPEDPIIEFYRQRQKRSEIPKSGKSVEEMEVWTQEFYKSIRQTRAAKHELFTARKKKFKKEETTLEYITVALVSGLVMGLIIRADLKNDKVQLFLDNLFSD